MPPPLPTHLGEHKRFSELNWTRPVLPSTPRGCSENQRRGKEGRVFRRNVTSPGPLPTAQSQPTQATTGHGPAWPASSTGLRAPVFQHRCRAWVSILVKYAIPIFLFFFINDKGFSSFISPPSIHYLLQKIIIYFTVKFIYFFKKL